MVKLRIGEVIAHTFSAVGISIGGNYARKWAKSYNYQIIVLGLLTCRLALVKKGR